MDLGSVGPLLDGIEPWRGFQRSAGWRRDRQCFAWSIRSPRSREAPMSRQVKYVLQESELPRQWYNVIPDLPPPPPPPLHPGTHQPVGPDDLAPLFPMELIRQEVTADPYVDIPGEVIDIYKLWRPTPLIRA